MKNIKNNKRLGVFIAEVWLPPARNVIQGIFDLVSCCGFDVLVFTHFTNHGNSYFQMTGEENIYRLAAIADLDAAVIVGNRFQRKEILTEVEQILSENKIPSVACEYSSDVFPSVFFDDRDNFRILTEHVINIHGCRDIICLTGPAEWTQSEQRLKGYCDALENAGIPVNNEKIIYGDFWLNSAEKLAEDIRSGKTAMPEAILCANDIMAISLITNLLKAGINVPDDIIVCGLDGTHYSDLCTPSLTTFSDSEYDLGTKAATEILKILGISFTGNLKRKSGIRTGDSCGCGRKNDYLIRYNSDIFADDNLSSSISQSTLPSELNRAANLDELIHALENHYEFFIIPFRHYILLCEDWNGDDINYRKNGYPEKMNQILYTRAYWPSDLSEHIFRTEDLLPCLSEDHSPELYIFTPLNFGDRVFGYCVLQNENADSTFHGFYRQYTTMLCSALENIRIRENNLRLRKKLEKYLSRDEMTGLSNEKGIIQHFSGLSIPNEHKTVNITVICIENSESIAEEYGDEAVKRLNAALIQSVNSFLDPESLFGVIKSRIFSVFSDSQTDTETFCVHIQDRFEKLTESLSFNDVSLFCETESIDYSEKSELTEKISQFIADAPRKYQNISFHSQHAARLKKLRSEIYRHPELKYNISETASATGLSVSHFQRLYLEQFGISCKRDIINAKISKAKDLLENTALSVNEISEKCGYDTPAHFMKQFKSETGMTALQYRKKS